MMTNAGKRMPAPSRGGTATVELAFIAPLILLFVFAGIEFGRLQMATHGLHAAAREGCRMAVTWNAVQQDVEQAVADRLGSFGIFEYELTTTPEPVSRALEWEPITIHIVVTYDNISWLPLPGFVRGITLRSSCTLPQESDHNES